MNFDDFKRAVRRESGVKILEDEPMSRHTSFKIGGPAFFLLPESAADMEKIFRLALMCGVRPLVVGNGTNLLVTDEPLEIPVISTGGMCGAEMTGEKEITAEAGIPMGRLAVFAAGKGLTGLEFAHGIPGTLGGGVFMNAGAYGGEIKDAAVKTAYLDGDGQLREAIGPEQDFSYRHSAFSGGGKVILKTVLALRKGEPEKIREKMAELNKKRRASQPLELPSAGSTFKRPKEGYAAALIDQAGLKGRCSGGAQVSEKHGGFIVNRGGATFDDVMRLIEIVQSEVLRQFNIELEPEVRIIRNQKIFH